MKGEKQPLTPEIQLYKTWLSPIRHLITKLTSESALPGTLGQGTTEDNRKAQTREPQTVLQGYRNLTTWCWPFTSLDLSLLIWHIKGLSLGLRIIKKDLNVLFVMNCESAFSRLAQCHQKAKFSYDINIQGNDNPEYQTFTVMLGDTRAWPWTVLHVSVHP